MQVMLMTFNKKRNSTAAPSGSAYVKEGTLRDGCSIVKPIIGFAIDRTTSPASYNYATISAWSRSYFIQDWIWDSGRWWAYMEVDTMGTYKGAIGRSLCYVLRAASEWDDTVTDEMYPAIGRRKSLHTILQNTSIDGSSFSEGTYVVGVMGKGDTDGAVNYYALTPALMKIFRNALLSDSSYVGVTEITDNLLKSLFNPAQYLVSANWFPYNISGSGSGSIGVGWWQSSASASKLTDFIIEREDSLTLEFQPDEPNWHAFMFSAPYSTYSIIFPPFGEIELDAQIVAEDMAYDPSLPSFGTLELTYEIRVDLISGNGYLLLKTNHGTILAFREGKLAVPVQLGQITQDIGGATGATIASSMTGASAAKMAGSTGFGVAVTVLGTLASATQYVTPKVKSIGMNAGTALYSFDIIAEMTYTPIVEDTPNENGRPLCKTKTISSLAGYIKTMNADVVLPNATDAEQELVRNMMNGGFFYE